MKDNRQVRWFLTISMIGIWSLVGYKIYKKIYPDDFQFMRPHEVAVAQTVASEIDSFSLALDYPDPFFKNSFPKERVAGTAISKPKLPVPKVPKKAKKPIPFPPVLYKGTVRADRSVVVVSVNGKVKNMAVGEELDGVTLVKIFQDSIHIRFEKEEKTILKEN